MEFRALSVRAPTGAPILRGGSGVVPSGSLCAVIGPSGAGKSTLLRAFCGRQALAGGSVHWDTRGRVVFLPQTDHLFDELTVSETVRFAVLLRTALRGADARAHAASAVAAAGLGAVQHTRVGSVSGGERRRLGCALELLTNPAVLLLDEPLSGLDAVRARGLVDWLAALCARGRTVLLSVHQPTARMMRAFDCLLLLAQDGTVVYCGPTAGARAALRIEPDPRAALAEVLLEHLCCPDPPAPAPEWPPAPVSERQASTGAGGGAPRRAKPAPASFWYLLKRERLLAARRSVRGTSPALQAAAFALAVGLAFGHLSAAPHDGLLQRLSLAVTLVVSIGFMDLAAVSPFLRGRQTFLHEAWSGVFGAGRFVAAHFLAGLPVLLQQASIVALVVSRMTGHPPGEWLLVAVLLLLGMCSRSMAFLVGAACSKDAAALRLLPVLQVLLLLFSGLFVPRTQLPHGLAWVAYASPAAHAFSLLLTAQLQTLCAQITCVDDFGDPAPDWGNDALLRSNLTLPVSGATHVAAMLAFAAAGLSAAVAALHLRAHGPGCAQHRSACRKRSQCAHHGGDFGTPPPEGLGDLRQTHARHPEPAVHAGV